MPKPIRQTPTGVIPRKGPRSSVVDRIESGVSFDESDGIKIILYGRSGSGKTTVWSSFPGPILAVVCSGGMKPGELRSIPVEYRKKVHPVTISSSLEFKELIEHQEATNKYKTVVLDHVTGFQDKILAELLDMDELPAQKSWGLANQQTYGTMSLQAKQMFRQAFSLDCNVVFVGQERENGTEGDSELITPHVGIALTPSLAGWLYPAADYVCHTFIRPKMVEKVVKIGGKNVTSEVRGKGVEYCLRVGPHDSYITKFRAPKGSELPDVIVDADYDKIMEIIQG